MFFRNEDYREIALGRFEFGQPPKVIPERHDDRLALLATAEHEQAHAVLASQTTHGVIVSLAGKYLSNVGKAAETDLRDALEDSIEDGRDVHEMFATFISLRDSDLYEPLISIIPNKYTDYLGAADGLAPAVIQGTRMGRGLVYAAALASLSPALPVPEAGVSAETLLKRALRHVMGSNRRFSLIKRYVKHAPDKVLHGLTLCAIKAGWSEESAQLSMSEAVPRDSADYEAEQATIENAASWLGEFVFNDRPPVATLTVLPASMRLYRDIICPGYRMGTNFNEWLGLTRNDYFVLHRLFNEQIEADLGHGITFQRHLAFKSAAVRRILAGVLAETANNIVGFARNAFPFALPADVTLLPETKSVEWALLTGDLRYYRNHKAQSLVAPFADVLSEMEFLIAERLIVAVSPALARADKDMRSKLEVFHARGGRVVQIMALTFLIFWEWLYRRDEDGTTSRVICVIRPVPKCDYHIIACWFGDVDATWPYVRLAGATTLLGLSELADRGLATVTDGTPAEWAWLDDVAGFLRVFWR